MNLAPLRSIAYLANRWILRRQEIVAAIPERGLRFHVRTADVNGRHLYKYHVLEAEVTSWIERSLRFADDDVVVDVGANIGWYSLLIDRLAPNPVAVLAFEPDPGNFALLETNLAINGSRRVHAVRAALGESAGTATLYRHGESNLGRHSLLPVNQGDAVSVATVRLDDYWARLRLGERIPRLIKMDIEGYELPALRGAAGVLARCPLLIAEFSPGLMRAGGIDPAALVSFLESAGLSPHRIGTAGLVPARHDELLSSDQQLNLAWTREQPRR
jgi:FkbM family methyltransferase